MVGFVVFLLVWFCFFFLFVTISASKGFWKPDCYAWGRKEKANWTIERYRRWNWITRSWGMATLICTVLLYLAYFYGKSKFDLVLVLPWRNLLRYEKKAEQIQWALSPRMNFHWLLCFTNTCTCLASEKNSRT